MSQVSRRWRMEWWLLATLGSGRTSVSGAAMAYYRELGAHEEVRGFLPAVVVGVQDRHVPIDFRIVEPGATMAIQRAVASYPLCGDRDVRAEAAGHAVAFVNLQDGLDRVAKVVEGLAVSRILGVLPA